MKKMLNLLIISCLFLLVGCGATTTITTKESTTIEPTIILPTTTEEPTTTYPFNLLNYDGYSLVWSDEFDGTSLNLDYWNYQLGNGTEYGISGWGNNEKQIYDETSTTVSGGTLKISATKNGDVINSSRLTTKDKKGFTYGIIEAKLKLPEGQGFWPAFWMLPSSTKYGTWPLSGEIDIMEARGRVLTSTSSAIHFGKGTVHMYYSEEQTFKNNAKISDFHTYSLLWTSEGMYFYVDGDLYYEILSWNDRFNQYTMPAPFDTDFYIILNLAVGGNFDQGLVPLDTDYPGVMEVDYVRVYQTEA